jgi:TM2 domain-containing membrane protein YozV
LFNYIEKGWSGTAVPFLILLDRDSYRDRLSHHLNKRILRKEPVPEFVEGTIKKMRATIIILLFFLSLNVFSESAEVLFIENAGIVIESEFIDVEQSEFNHKGPNPILKLFRKKQKNNRKITAAILAFPFPFGIVGLHRIYLGTKPYVPIAYIATLGGVFGILPLIDFCAILLEKDLAAFENNGKVLMWVK